MERLHIFLFLLFGWIPICIGSGGSGHHTHDAHQRDQLMRLLHGSSPAYSHLPGGYGHACHGHPCHGAVQYSLATRPSNILVATGHSMPTTAHHNPPPKPKPDPKKVILEMLNDATRDLYAVEGDYAEKIAKAQHLKELWEKASHTLHQTLINNEARLEKKVAAAHAAERRK